MKNTTQTSRRKLLTQGLAGLVGATALSAIPARAQTQNYTGEGCSCVPKEGSLIDGRKVVYIDGTTRLLNQPKTHYVLIEGNSKTLEIKGDDITLDGLNYKIFGVDAYGNNINVKNINLGFASGQISINTPHLFLTGNNNIAEEIIGDYPFEVLGKNNLIKDSEYSVTHSEDIANIFKDCKYRTESPQSSLTRQTTYQPTVLGPDGQPANEALVSLVRQDGQITLALPTGFDGKINPTPVTTYVLQEGLKSDRAPFMVLVDGKIRGSWDGTNGLEQVIQLQ